MVIKCKPVYSFQSVEFEYEIHDGNPKDIEAMFLIYKLMLDGLQKIAVDQPALAKPVAKPQKPKEEGASEGQIKWLISLGVPEDEARSMTKKEAADTIRELK